MRKLPYGIGAFSLVLAILGGMLAGVGAFTFGYGEGHSYLRDDPNACINCHIMQDQYDSWLNSSHSAHANCNDCHLPNEFAHRWIAKADNGFFHAWAFTFQDFHEPIQIKERNLQILQNNCIACHQTMVHQILPVTVVTLEGISCMQCHHSVGHAARTAGMPRRIFPE
jgi:cytochrome c nitrite reductase small subunit